jgi:hypothetical protein
LIWGKTLLSCCCRSRREALEVHVKHQFDNISIPAQRGRLAATADNNPERSFAHAKLLLQLITTLLHLQDAKFTEQSRNHSRAQAAI